ncbi:MAG: indolepyruvate oxidoreductase subunit beta [Deltaproteobacteria bacterium]|nr:indolepyruvate oxidoreductase subunit beta [Deltaproteobacteria bacterium]
MSGGAVRGNFGGQQIVVSGVGGQGVLFVTRLLADAAILRGEPVLTSETHGMAQRGGIVVSHLKAGAFASPLVRPGSADGLIALKDEYFSLHRGFLKPGGWIVVNSARGGAPEGGENAHAVDADGLARESGAFRSANLVLLGFALSRLGAADHGGRLFCSPDDIREALRHRAGGKESLVAASISALALGILHGKR